MILCDVKAAESNASASAPRTSDTINQSGLLRKPDLIKSWNVISGNTDPEPRFTVAHELISLFL